MAEGPEETGMTGRAPHPAPPTAPPMRGSEAGFDRELDVRGILWTAGGILAVTALTMVLTWWLAGAFRDRLVAADPPRPEVVRALPGDAAAAPASGPALPTGSLLPPAPVLQPGPERELEAIRAEEDRRLAGYGWVDREAGIARVPIEKAMAEVARQGLPRWAEAPAGDAAAVQGREQGASDAAGSPDAAGPSGTSGAADAPPAAGHPDAAAVPPPAGREGGG